MAKAFSPRPPSAPWGCLKNVHRMATVAFKREGDALILIGETKGHLGQSIYLREIEGREEGAAPPVDLASEKRNGDFVRSLIEQGRVDTVHDVSDGGLLVALAEMAMAGSIGAEIALPDGASAIPFLFGEDQARYVLAVPAADADKIVGRRHRSRRPRRFAWQRAAIRSRSKARARSRSPHCAKPTKPGSPPIWAAPSFRRPTDGTGVPMAMSATEIEKLIKEAFPDADITITDLAGDNDHYAAMVTSAAFKGKSRVQQHQMVYEALKGRMGGVLHALSLQTTAKD